jgi:hypothetical protein
VTEPGTYTVDLKVTYDGVTSAGQVTQPYPSGDILGTPDGRFYFYVTPKGSAPLATNVPESLLGSYSHQIFPYTITTAANSGHVTAVIPGFVVASGPVAGSGGTFQFTYDPAGLSTSFPISAQQFSNGDMGTITLFDPTTNLARIVVFNGWQLLNMEAPGSVAAAVNAATFSTGALAPGSIASVFGSNLATSTAAAAGFPLPSTLGGATVELNGITAPITYASPGQVNFQVPWELLGQTQAQLVVSGSPPLTVNLAPVGPGIFAVVQEDRYLVIYCTGLGDVTIRPQTGAAAGSDLSYTLATTTINIAGENVSPLFSGLAPSFAGLYQVNVQLPPDVTSGSAVPVTLTIGGASSNTVNVAIQ